MTSTLPSVLEVWITFVLVDKAKVAFVLVTLGVNVAEFVIYPIAPPI